jgi:hypothetical protein
MFVKYNPTGEIVAVVDCDEKFSEYYPEFTWFGLFATVTPWSHYIDLTDPENPTPAERPASPVTRTDLTLHDVPNGATLWINGVSYPAEGEVELQFTLPGTYSLRVECFPFLDWTDEVAIP